jgi:inhibitor of cysteine peptidase
MGLFRKNTIFNTLFLIAIYWLPNNTYAKNLVFSVKPASPMVKVRLPANPSTGYQWAVVQYDSTLMLPPSSQYIPQNRNLAGASGQSVWEFKFKKGAFRIPQKTVVILEYKRPWEKAEGNRQSICFIIHPS